MKNIDMIGISTRLGSLSLVLARLVLTTLFAALCSQSSVAQYVDTSNDFPPKENLDLDISSREPISIEWDNIMMLAFGVRVESPDESLIGKASLPENRNLCAPDDCIGLSPNATEPNERFLAAPGLMSSNTDDGNLNYDKGDPVLGFIKWDSRVSVAFSNLEAELSWLFLFDAINYGFEESATNQIVAEGPQPGEPVRFDRAKETERDLGQVFEIRDAFVAFDTEVFGREARVKVGRHLLNWGESAFVLKGNLNFINPYDTNNLFRPGFELEEIYRPVGMASFQWDWTDNIKFEGFYQFEWRPYALPSKGSVYSFLDAGNEVTKNETVVLPFAKTPSDPNQLQSPASDLLSLVSATSFSARRAENNNARHHGQFGFGIRIFKEDWFDGTELAFFLANYHARVPSLSAYATDASCTRREGNVQNNDAANLVDFTLDCGIVGVDTPGEDFEALPLDSFRYFLDYPEDIHLFGATFNTQANGFIFGGEFAYRDNQPVQVDIEDVIFAAIQPAFPRNEIVVIPETLGGVPAATLTDSRTAAPDYLTAYRGGTPGEVAPNQIIRGYESMETIQLTLTATKIFGGQNKLFGADQIAILAELQGIWVPNLPGLDEIQFEGPGTHTHASPGIAETGNALLLNPTQNTDGYVTETSWGYRLTMIGQYDNFPVEGVSMRPLIVWLHDIKGVSPGLAENFLEGRQLGIFQTDFRMGEWTLGTTYNYFGGGGDNNAFRDRDFMSVYLRYSF